MPDEAIIFDMDGTLADSIEQYCRMARDVTDLTGAPPVPRERVLALMGSGQPDLLRRLLPDDFPDAEAALERAVRLRLRGWMRSLDDVDPLPQQGQRLADRIDIVLRLGAHRAVSLHRRFSAG